MATKTAYANPGSAASVDRGTDYVAWSSTGNIVSSNNARASSAVTTPKLGTDSLEAYNFGFSIPTNAIVTKVYVSFEGYVDSADAVTLYLEPDRTARDPIYMGNTSLTTSEATYEDTRIWTNKTGPTPAQVNSPNFAVYLYGDTTIDRTYYIDHIKVAVEYEILAEGLFWANNC